MTAPRPESAASMPRDPFGPAQIGPVDLRNRVLKAATFEGLSPANVVSGALIDFHRRMAAGAVAATPSCRSSAASARPN